LLQQKRDPIEERYRERSEAATEIGSENPSSRRSHVTLRRYTRDYHSKHVEPVRTFKHGQQWINSIEQHVPATLLDSAPSRITAVDLLDALVAILREVPETN
jgi:hypothetical protein